MRTGAPIPRCPLETSKSHERRLREGWFERFCPETQPGIDIGCSQDPVHDAFDQWDLAFGDGDATEMCGVASESYATVYASHLLEHLTDPVAAVRRWFELLIPHGHLIVCVPHRDLYEKQLLLPSRFNAEHRCYWLPDRYEPPHTFSLGGTIADALQGQPHWLRLLRVLDDGRGLEPPGVHAAGEYTIEAVVQKLSPASFQRA